MMRETVVGIIQFYRMVPDSILSQRTRRECEMVSGVCGVKWLIHFKLKLASAYSPSLVSKTPAEWNLHTETHLWSKYSIPESATSSNRKHNNDDKYQDRPRLTQIQMDRIIYTFSVIFSPIHELFIGTAVYLSLILRKSNPISISFPTCTP
jgi:hypothetical protein